MLNEWIKKVASPRIWMNPNQGYAHDKQTNNYGAGYSYSFASKQTNINEYEYCIVYAHNP